MTLKEYLSAHRESATDFAARIGTSVASVSRLANGKMKPSLPLAHKIEAATKGKVKTEVWL